MSREQSCYSKNPGGLPRFGFKSVFRNLQVPNDIGRIRCIRYNNGIHSKFKNVRKNVRSSKETCTVIG